MCDGLQPAARRASPPAPPRCRGALGTLGVRGAGCLSGFVGAVCRRYRTAALAGTQPKLAAIQSTLQRRAADPDSNWADGRPLVAVSGAMGSPNAGPPAAAVLAPGVPASPGNHAPAAHRAAHSAHEATLLSGGTGNDAPVRSRARSALLTRAARAAQGRRSWQSCGDPSRRPSRATRPTASSPCARELSPSLCCFCRGSRRLPTQRAARCCAGGDPGRRRQR